MVGFDFFDEIDDDYYQSEVDEEDIRRKAKIMSEFMVEMEKMKQVVKRVYTLSKALSEVPTETKEQSDSWERARKTVFDQVKDDLERRIQYYEEPASSEAVKEYHFPAEESIKRFLEPDKNLAKKHTYDGIGVKVTVKDDTSPKLYFNPFWKGLEKVKAMPSTRITKSKTSSESLYKTLQDIIADNKILCKDCNRMFQIKDVKRIGGHDSYGGQRCVIDCKQCGRRWQMFDIF